MSRKIPNEDNAFFNDGADENVNPCGGSYGGARDNGDGDDNGGDCGNCGEDSAGCGNEWVTRGVNGDIPT